MKEARKLAQATEESKSSTYKFDMLSYVILAGYANRVAALVGDSDEARKYLSVEWVGDGGDGKAGVIGRWAGQAEEQGGGGWVNILNSNLGIYAATHEDVKQVMNNIGKLVGLKYMIHVSAKYFHQGQMLKSYKILDTILIPAPKMRLVSVGEKVGARSEKSAGRKKRSVNPAAFLVNQFRKIATRKKSDLGEGHPETCGGALLLMEQGKKKEWEAVNMKQLLAKLWLYELKKFCSTMKNWAPVFKQQNLAPSRGSPKETAHTIHPTSLIGTKSASTGSEETAVEPAYAGNGIDGTGVEDMKERWESTRRYLNASFASLDRQLKKILFGGNTFSAKKFAALEAASLKHQPGATGVLKALSLLRGKADKKATPSRVVSSYPGAEWTVELDADVFGKGARYQEGGW